MVKFIFDFLAKIKNGGCMDQVLNHHLYEYKKGLRRLILHTVMRKDVAEIVARFRKHDIAHTVILLGEKRANIFFGDEVCVDVIKSIGKTSLSEYTPEEDFILGTMLGYCRRQQCERYLKLKNKSQADIAILAG